MDQYYLLFSTFFGIGPKRFRQLINHFKTVKAAAEAEPDSLIKTVGPLTAENFVKHRDSFDFKALQKQMREKQIIFLSQEHPNYPQQFRHLPDPPIGMYTKGQVSLLNISEDPYFGIVGTRNPSDYGKQVAQKFSRELTQAGFIIVSGMAAGIDAQAHWGAIQAKGKTIAVLGCGVDVIYPYSNRKLYEAILKSGGVIMSEFPPGMTVRKGLFVSRNRLVSALSKGILVVEGLKDSGSLITARLAAEQGKDVFAPPVPITYRQSEAPSYLVKQGAKLVTSVDDILEEYDMQRQSSKQNQVLQSLKPEQKDIYALLMQDGFSADELSQRLRRPIHQVLPQLSSLEISGVIQKSSGGKYRAVL